MVWSFKASTAPIFFAGGLALLMALEQLARKKPNRVNVLFTLIFLCCSIIIFGAGFVANWIPPRHPWTIYLFFTAICSVGPCYYFYFNLLLHPEKEFNARAMLHFVPAFGSWCVETGFQAMPLEFKQRWFEEMFNNPPQNALIILVIIGAAHAFSYLAYLLKMDLGMVWNVEEIKAELRLIFLVDVLAILTVVGLYAGFMFKMPRLFDIGGNILAVLMVGVFLGYNRYSNFLQMLKTEIEKKQYEKSALNGVDTEQINDRLMELLETEKVFTETDLNLRGLAHMLSITPHQLSQYLNERLGMDFRSFLNSYRVREAMRLLTQDKDMNILTICYEVGFGSKSTFNTVFKKETGKTPREFRENALSSPD